MSVVSAATFDVLKERVQATHVEAKDTSGGCGASFEVKIVSPAFEGKTLIQRHRLVNDALRDEIAKLHAFSQKTFTPAQWEEEKAKNST